MINSAMSLFFNDGPSQEWIFNTYARMHDTSIKISQLSGENHFL